MTQFPSSIVTDNGSKVNLDAIPEELKAIPHWVLWRARTNGKQPIFSTDGKLASSTNYDTWDYYSEVVEVLDSYDGLGFVLEYGITCIDLDDCIHGGVLSDYATGVVNALNSYTEISRSGTGLHIFVYGDLPANKKTSAIELYHTERYIAITGNRLTGTLPTVEHRQNELTRLYESLPATDTTFIPVQPNTQYPPRTDAGVIDAIMRYGSENAKRLWRGQWERRYNSQSEADMAMVRYIAYFANRVNVEQIDRVFRLSGLHREKWDRDIGGYTYGMRTIARVTGSRL